MARHNQMRLVLHGGLFMVISMVAAGIPGFVAATHHLINDPIRQFFRQSHSIFMATGIWMIATAPVLSWLGLTARGIASLVWSLVISGYTFLVALIVLFIGFQLHAPSANEEQWKTLMAMPGHLGWIYIWLVALSGSASLVAGALIVRGAYKAAQKPLSDFVH